MISGCVKKKKTQLPSSSAKKNLSLQEKDTIHGRELTPKVFDLVVSFNTSPKTNMEIWEKNIAYQTAPTIPSVITSKQIYRTISSSDWG